MIGNLAITHGHIVIVIMRLVRDSDLHAVTLRLRHSENFAGSRETLA